MRKNMHTTFQFETVLNKLSQLVSCWWVLSYITRLMSLLLWHMLHCCCNIYLSTSTGRPLVRDINDSADKMYKCWSTTPNW